MQRGWWRGAGGRAGHARFATACVPGQTAQQAPSRRLQSRFPRHPSRCRGGCAPLAPRWPSGTGTRTARSTERLRRLRSAILRAAPAGAGAVGIRRPPALGSAPPQLPPAQPQPPPLSPPQHLKLSFILPRLAVLPLPAASLWQAPPGRRALSALAGSRAIRNHYSSEQPRGGPGPSGAAPCPQHRLGTEPGRTRSVAPPPRQDSRGRGPRRPRPRLRRGLKDALQHTFGVRLRAGARPALGALADQYVMPVACQWPPGPDRGRAQFPSHAPENQRAALAVPAAAAAAATVARAVHSGNLKMARAAVAVLAAVGAARRQPRCAAAEPGPAAHVAGAAGAAKAVACGAAGRVTVGPGRDSGAWPLASGVR